MLVISHKYAFSPFFRTVLVSPAPFVLPPELQKSGGSLDSITRYTWNQVLSLQDPSREQKGRGKQAENRAF